MLAFVENRCHIKWTLLASLPAQMWEPYIAVYNNKVYVSGSSPKPGAEQEVYVYNNSTDQWGHLP